MIAKMQPRKKLRIKTKISLGSINDCNNPYNKLLLAILANYEEYITMPLIILITKMSQTFNQFWQQKTLPITCSIIFGMSLAINLTAQLSRPDDPKEFLPIEDKDTATIYLDFTNSSLGRSPYRRLRFNIELSALSEYMTYPVAEPTGWSTAVFVSDETEQKLRMKQLPLSPYINDKGGIYYLQYKGIRIVFGLEVPPKKVFDIIATTYKYLPKINEQVTEYYKNGYTVRIYEAENVLDAENHMISYPEAILAATIIGAKEQWLWGIHDGRDLLNQPLK